MQNTRLSTLIEQFFGRFAVFLRNPWRRLSVLTISLLGGNFLATILSTVAGQNADLDILVAFLLVAIAEIISWLIYGSDRRRTPGEIQRGLWLEIFNGLKLGLTYGLFVEAFKLGS